MEANNPYAPPVAPVRDVQPESNAHEPAERVTRLGASLLDGLILGLLVYVPFIVVVGVSAMVTSDGKFNYAALLAGAALLSLLPGLIVYTAVTIWLVLRNGQTMGKKLLGIKVVRTSGERAGLGRIFWLRNVVISVIGFIPIIGYIVGIVDVLLIFRESRKCLHDQIADTIVIRA